MKIKKNLSLDSNVIARVQDYADKMGLSLSGAFATLAISRLDELKSVDAMGNFKTFISELTKAGK